MSFGTAPVEAREDGAYVVAETRRFPVAVSGTPETFSCYVPASRGRRRAYSSNRLVYSYELTAGMTFTMPKGQEVGRWRT